jgi:ABC-type polar amino acid transport system ATPase subunit
LILEEKRSVKPSDLIPDVATVENVFGLQKYVHLLKDSISIKLDMTKVHKSNSSKSTLNDHLENLKEISNGLITTTDQKTNITLGNYGFCIFRFYT